MARRGPSLTALLGLLAVAGYQNRDKLSGLLAKLRNTDTNGASDQSLADQLQEMLKASPLGGAVSSAIAELVDMFSGTPQEKAAQSWVRDGVNDRIAPDELADVIGRDALDDISRKTGMSRDAILEALANRLPSAVDAMTPKGRLPTAEESTSYI